LKVTKVDPKAKIVLHTQPKSDKAKGAFAWWKAKSKKDRCDQLIATAVYLKDSQTERQRMAALYARLYGNVSLYSFAGAQTTKINDQKGLPTDRPTFNIVQSAVDTLVSRIGQSRPAPVFLTDNSDYKERNLAKKLNTFILGEFYCMKAYEKAVIMLRDALVEGTGCLKVYRTSDDRVALDRVLLTELMTDPNESIYGEPRQLYQTKLVDRAVLMEQCPEYKATIEKAESAYPDNSADSSKTVSDLVMVVEGWRLPSSKTAKDGRHTIACSSGELLDEPYTRDRFPFVFMHYSPRLLGFWSQGLAEQLMGTQIEINQLLHTITRAIRLVGVPRVFLEMGSKVNKSAQNNDVGVIVEYQGTKPSYEVAPCVPQEMYSQLQRLIDYGFQQCGVSAMQASSTKPAGLNSGEAIRSYDDIATDRFNALSRRYDTAFIDLAYQVIELAKEIAKETGSYSTVYPHKNGTKEIDLTKADLVNDDYVIQCFNQSSLPRDPAGRKQAISEYLQAGLLSPQEARRLLDFPDLSQIEQLENAAEERIFQQLDNIVEDGIFSGPDTFTNFELAEKFTVQYLNLYSSNKLEEEKMQMLRDYYQQIQDLKMAAMPPAPPQGADPNVAPQVQQAVPAPPPVSDLLPRTAA
jgi:hypothetical protein